MFIFLLILLWGVFMCVCVCIYIYIYIYIYKIGDKDGPLYSPINVMQRLLIQTADIMHKIFADFYSFYFDKFSTVLFLSMFTSQTIQCFSILSQYCTITTNL